jgi:hypothetical protein
VVFFNECVLVFICRVSVGLLSIQIIASRIFVSFPAKRETMMRIWGFLFLVNV